MSDSDRLAATIRAWGKRITFTVTPLSGEGIQVTAFYQGGQVAFRDHAMRADHLTPGQVASALWAITAVVRRTRTLDAFCAFMSNRHKGGSVMLPTDLDAQAMFAEWDRVAHEAVALFGETFGHNTKGLLSDLEMGGGRNA